MHGVCFSRDCSGPARALCTSVSQFGRTAPKLIIASPEETVVPGHKQAQWPLVPVITTYANYANMIYNTLFSAIPQVSDLVFAHRTCSSPRILIRGESWLHQHFNPLSAFFQLIHFLEDANQVHQRIEAQVAE
jgi:hypothetical protein